jgi:NitT/TauT family transport system substrate-binding protein
MIGSVAVGAHMRGLPLNAELVSLGGVFVRAVETAPCYRMFLLPGGPPLRPGMLRGPRAAPPSPPNSGRSRSTASAASSPAFRRRGHHPLRRLARLPRRARCRMMTPPATGERLMITRRMLVAGAALTPLAAPHVARAQANCVVKMGSLRLIHSMTPHFSQRFAPAGLTIEITTFDSPTDGKNAVVTRSVDFGGFGIAAATLGAAAREPVVVIGAFCNRGMGVIARGDIDAYVGAEPGPGLSISSGVGTLVEYPYGTVMGGLNMIFATSQALVDSDPALCRTMLTIHRRASEYMMANKAEVAEATVRILGAPRAAVDQALNAGNVEYIWNLDETVMRQSRPYAEQMLSLRQTRRLPDFDRLLNPTFSRAAAGA